MGLGCYEEASPFTEQFLVRLAVLRFVQREDVRAVPKPVLDTFLFAAGCRYKDDDDDVEDDKVAVKDERTTRLIGIMLSRYSMHRSNQKQLEEFMKDVGRLSTLCIVGEVAIPPIAFESLFDALKAIPQNLKQVK